MLLLIGGKATQWKRNILTRLNTITGAHTGWATMTIIDFVKEFKKHFDEVDDVGSALTKIFQLHRKKLKPIPYTNQFKELIFQTKIASDAATIPYYSQGLPTEITRHCLLKGLTTLDQWYNEVMVYEAASSRTQVLSAITSTSRNSYRPRRGPDDMDVDAIIIAALSKEERERHVKENLCFICHKSGHMSGACPMRKKDKGKKYQKGKKGFKPRHRQIRAASTDENEADGASGEEEESSSISNIRALLAKLPLEERLEILNDVDGQDF
jgi:hypothetical protein